VLVSEWAFLNFDSCQRPRGRPKDLPLPVLSPPPCSLSSIMSVRNDKESAAPRLRVTDEALLAQLGYKQEFKRDFSKLELAGMCFSIVGVVQSIASVFFPLCLLLFAYLTAL